MGLNYLLSLYVACVKSYSNTAYRLIVAALLPFTPRSSTRLILLSLLAFRTFFTVSGPMPGTLRSASLSAVLILTG